MARRNGNTVAGVWRAFSEDAVSSNNTTTTVTLECNMESIAWGINIYNFYAEANIAGNVKSTSTASFYSGTGQTVQKNLVRHSASFSRTHSSQTKTCSIKIVNSTGYKNGTSSLSFNFTVPAKPSYTVSYNANGGSGAPGNQTKWYGENLTLSGTKPTRTGYSFQGWATSSGGSVAYNAGATYSGNSALTLYAVWKANTYTVSYNANGGSGAPGNQTKTYGVTLTLSSTRPTRTNYNFVGWSTSNTATSAQYQPGGQFTTNANTTLYAVWSLAYIAPRITNLTAMRCNSAGTLADDGTYAKIEFSWTTDRTVSLVRINCNGTNTDISSSGTSGSVSRVVGSGGLNTENSYTVTVTVNDSNGGSTTSTTVPPLAYIMDVAPNGSVSFGGIADNNEKNMTIENPLNIHDLVRGFQEVGYTGNTTTWYYKVLARGQDKNNSNSSYGVMRIHGTLGGWGADANGSIDLRISTRDQTSSNVRISAYDDCLYNNDCARIIARLGTDGYVYLILARKQYYAYNLILEGYQVVLVDSAWSTQSGIVSATSDDIFNTALRYTTCNYPAKMRYSGGYWGLAPVDDEDKTTDAWTRTSYQGLIPSSQGGNSSALGTVSWPFSSAWINQLNWTGNGLKGRVMKQLWSGTWTSGSLTLSELPNYNVFLFGLGNDQVQDWWVIAAANPNRGSALVPVYVTFWGYNVAGQHLYNPFKLNLQNTTITINQRYGNGLFSDDLVHGATQASRIHRIYGIL